jgi:hypothetical protein
MKDFDTVDPVWQKTPITDIKGKQAYISYHISSLEYQDEFELTI